ncbi:phospholipid scramblase 1-like isoform X2 [Pomacea canaliculata]|nr:phospholipid scramblase 1-like isoform X2 [Pomacea canaliculata]XP_025089177.1 phospholipid scramblase 1-like isoform X2 [Pomacea canaliculata]
MHHGGNAVAPSPVLTQPGQMVFMPLPPSVPGCPPGLEYLTQLDQILIKQEVEILEVLTGLEGKNKYSLVNTLGQQVYYAAEESELCHRIFCGTARGFILHITDNSGQEVMRLVRDFVCCTGCFCLPCKSCRYMAYVQDRTGQILGYTSNLHFCCSPRAAIYDADQQMIAEMSGPPCVCQDICCTADVDFPVYDVKGSSWGKVAKQWSGAMKEWFTTADNFCVSFPMDLDVKKKALMICLCIYVDFMIFEYKDQNNDS